MFVCLFFCLVWVSLQDDLCRLTADLLPYTDEESGEHCPTLSGCTDGRRSPPSRRLLPDCLEQAEAREGIGNLSHKKKAKFWRGVVQMFPNVIDFLCNPRQDLGQARLSKCDPSCPLVNPARFAQFTCGCAD